MSAANVEQRLFPPWSLASRERAALTDAGRLAEIWQYALGASFRMGDDTGYQRGLIEGRGEEAAAWQAIFTGYSALISEPARAELARLRAPSNAPCRHRCGTCAQCFYAEVVIWNLAHYGRPDFPGVVAAARIARGKS